MIKLRHALLFCALLTACATDERAEEEPLPGSELVAVKKDDADGRTGGHRAADMTDRGAKPGQRRPAPRSCDDLQESARTLLSNFQQCTDDSDCISGKVDAPCLAPFLCQVSVKRNGDLQTLARDARSLSLTYRQACSDRCPVARCISPESLHTFCDRNTNRCASEMRTAQPQVDAGSEPTPVADAGVPPADAATQPPGTPSPFACTKNADCAVKNVGNCCGYYPRCANVAATFAPPKCEGQVGVCGFPAIDACECRENTCVALQGGQKI